MDQLIEHALKLANQLAIPLLAPIKNRIAYVVSHGQSYASNGYAIRTQGVAKALNEHGLETLCLVRPGRPWELGNEQHNVAPEMEIDGVRYIHTRWTTPLPPKAVDKLTQRVDKYIELFRIYRPQAVLAASNHTVGLPAWIAAKKLGIPFYNEVRGFWELSRDAREPGYAKTQASRQEAERDAFVAKQAQKVFTLNQPMANELIKRGVAASKLAIVPNGVSALPKLAPARAELKAKLGIKENEKVIGYIGSFSVYEGLDTLLDACEQLIKQGEAIKLLLVGDDQPITTASGTNKAMADKPWLTQVGRVPHEQIADYYALLDAVVISRKPLTVCNIVPPMKAAEALAHGKRLVVSDVAPLAEYADKYDGVVSFEAGSAASLATALQRSLKLPAQKPSTELLFSAHTEPMAKALKGGSSEPAAQSAAVPAAKSASAVLSMDVLGSRVPNSALKKTLGIAENEKVIGVVSSDENLYGLIDACTKLVESGEKLKVLLLGSNSASLEHDAVKNEYLLAKKPSWLIQVALAPGEQVADYYSLLDVVVVLRDKYVNFSATWAGELIFASHYNLPLLMPEYCRANVNDYLANVVFYHDDCLEETIKYILPYTECGKYQDDRSAFYSYLGCFGPIALYQPQEKGNVIELLNVLADKDSGKIILEKEKEIRAFVDSEQSSGRICNALSISKLLYENTGSIHAFKSYVKSLFFAQKYDHVVRLCEGCDNIGKELEVLIKKSKSYLALFENYYKYCQIEKVNGEFSPHSKKSVYFLHSSLPYFSGGYATRAHGLASALVEKGLDVRAYTRPNFPYDVKKDISDRIGSVKVDEITYQKTACSSVRTRDEASYMLDCVEVFDKVIKREKPGYIHGRSTYQIALPALIAAKMNNLPFVYEVSGLWEIVHESRETASQRKHETEKIRHLETMVAKKADLVFTLTGAMKDELIARGVDGSKITILPNCTNPDKFLPREKSQSLLSKLGIGQNTPVIGYIGSFQDYEGLDDLIAACEILSDRKPDLDYRLLLVGDGPYYKQICDLAKKSSVKDKIIITGRVPHSLASEYYSVVDIAPFPRKSWPVCEMVSPMKPLEALAMEKTVLVSSVKALSEMVVDGETGVIFDKGSVPSLSQTLLDLIVDPVKRVRLGKNARSWVIKNRTWKEVSDTFGLSVFS